MFEGFPDLSIPKKRVRAPNLLDRICFHVFGCRWSDNPLDVQEYYDVGRPPPGKTTRPRWWKTLRWLFIVGVLVIPLLWVLILCS